MDGGADAYDDVTTTLTAHAIDFKVWTHASFEAPIRSPAEFAEALRYDVERIVKTLFLVDKTDRTRHAFVGLSANSKLDFGATARVVGWNKTEAGTPEELATVGFPRHGVAPVGLSGEPAAAVVLDEALFHWPSILIGSGRAGVELEVDPEALLGLPGAVRAAVSSDAGT